MLCCRQRLVPAEILRPGHVPLTSGPRACTSAIRKGLHRERQSSRATSALPWAHRPAPHGLGRVRASGRAAQRCGSIGTRRRRTRGTTSPFSLLIQALGFSSTTGSGRSTPPTRRSTSLVDPGGSSSSSSGGAFAYGDERPLSSVPLGPAPSSPTRRSSTAGARSGTSRSRSATCASGSCASPPTPSGCWPTSRTSTGRNPQNGCRRRGSGAARGPRSPSAWKTPGAGEASKVFTTRPDHPLRLHLPRPRASSTPLWRERPSRPSGRHWRPTARPPAKSDPAAHRLRQGQVTPHGVRMPSTPPTARVFRLDRRLRPDGLRHRRHYGSAGPRRARPRVRHALWAADHSGDRGRGSGGAALHRLRRALTNSGAWHGPPRRGQAAAHGRTGSARRRPRDSLNYKPCADRPSSTPHSPPPPLPIACSLGGRLPPRRYAARPGAISRRSR